MDFRGIAVEALKWFPQSRKVVPATSFRVQTPPCRCAIRADSGRYVIQLDLAGHPTHSAFASFVRQVELHAQQHARPLHATQWCPSIVDGVVPTMRLSAFDDARVYDEGGQLQPDPCGVTCCSCMLEFTGAWTTETHWGLRWKVLEVKSATQQLSAPCMLLPDPLDHAPPGLLVDLPADLPGDPPVDLPGDLPVDA